MESSPGGKPASAEIRAAENKAASDADRIKAATESTFQEAAPDSPFKVVEPTRRSGGGNKLVWLALIVAVGIILAYAAGMLR